MTRDCAESFADNVAEEVGIDQALISAVDKLIGTSSGLLTWCVDSGGLIHGGIPQGSVPKIPGGLSKGISGWAGSLVVELEGKPYIIAAAPANDRSGKEMIVVLALPLDQAFSMADPERRITGINRLADAEIGPPLTAFPVEGLDGQEVYAVSIQPTTAETK